MVAVAFALTYFLHSSIWILLVSYLVKIPFFDTPLLKNYLWKGALIGGLCTSLLIHFSGNSLLEIQLGKEVIAPKSVEQQRAVDERLVHDTPNEIKPIVVEDIANKKVAISETTAKITTIEDRPNTAITPAPKTTFNVQKFINLAIQFFGICWIMGSLFFFLKEGIRHFIFIKKINPRNRINHPTLKYLQRQIRLKSGRTPQILLSQSATLESPILIQNKEICLPQKAVEKLEDAQMKAMLAHELAHVIRKDYYWNCFLILLDTLLFFQPLHRMAIKEIQTTNELLCDEWAAKIIGNNLALAQCLLTVAEWMKTPSKNYPLIARMSLKKSELSNRITSLINLPDMKKQRYQFLKAGLPFATLLLLAILILPGFTFTDTIDSIIDSNATDNLAEPAIEEPFTYHQHTHIDVHITDDEVATKKDNGKENLGVIIEDELNEIDNGIFNLNQPKSYANTVQRLEEDFKFKYLDVGYTRNIDVTPSFDPYQSDVPLGTPQIEEPKSLTPTIKLEEKFAVNKNHPYFELFQEVAQKGAIEGRKLDIKAIYYTNLSCAGTSRSKLNSPIVSNKGDKNSLIFTLDYGDRIEYDTLQNCVHPEGQNDGYAYKVKGRLSNWFGKQIYKATNTNIKGSHSPIVKSQWVQQSDNQKQTPMGLELLGQATVKIEVFTTKGKYITTVADGVFEAGKHEFIFSHINIKKGTYRLVSTVDGETLSQNIRVKRTRFTNKKEKNTCAALLRAVKRNNASEVQKLVQNTDPNCEYREEGEPRSPLNAAARKGNVEIGKILLATNADVEFRARGDEGALMGAARYGHLDFVKLMIENGAEVNKTVSGDGTALINAVRGGHYEVTEYLLQKGADPMLGVSGDENPIYHASNQGDKMLDLLLKYRKSK